MSSVRVEAWGDVAILGTLVVLLAFKWWSSRRSRRGR